MTDRLMDVPIARIKPNPKQPRTEFDPADLAELAGSIREHGVIQPVKVFESGPDEYTLIAGERRTRAADLAGKTVVPAIVTERPSDDVLEDEAIAENLQRKDLSVAELARAFQRLHNERGLTDEEIAQRFGKSRPYVTNIRLMAEDLPDEILDLVGGGAGQLPQEHARALRMVAGAVKPSELVKAAQKIAALSADEDNDDDPGVILSRLVDEATTELPDEIACWPLTWPEHPLQAGGLSIPACKGCENYLFVKSNFNENERRCARPECVAWKQANWPAVALQIHAQRTGIPVAAPDETVYTIPFTYNNHDKIKRWMSKPPKHLRLITGDVINVNTRYDRSRLLGSAFLALATVDRSVVEDEQAGQSKKIESVLPEAGESEADKAKRLAAEYKDYLARRTERSTKRRSVADVDWLGVNVIGLVAPQIEASGVTLKFMAEFVEDHDSPRGWLVLHERREAIRKQLGSVSKTVQDDLLRELIVVCVIGDAVCNDFDPHWRENYTRVRATVEHTITNQPKAHRSNTYMGLTLPSGWDEVPVHHTASNCWMCGQFTPGDEISKRDRDEFGWVVADDGTVTCSDECRSAWAKAANKAAKKIAPEAAKPKSAKAKK